MEYSLKNKEDDQIDPTISFCNELQIQNLSEGSLPSSADHSTPPSNNTSTKHEDIQTSSHEVFKVHLSSNQERQGDFSDSNQLIDPNFQSLNWKQKIFINGFYFSPYSKIPSKPNIQDKTANDFSEHTRRMDLFYSDLMDRISPLPSESLTDHLTLNSQSEKETSSTNDKFPGHTYSNFDFKWMENLDFETLQSKIDSNIDVPKNLESDNRNLKMPCGDQLDKITYTVKDDNGKRQFYEAESFLGAPTIYYKNNVFTDLNLWLSYMKSGLPDHILQEMEHLTLENNDDYKFNEKINKALKEAQMELELYGNNDEEDLFPKSDNSLLTDFTVPSTNDPDFQDPFSDSSLRLNNNWFDFFNQVQNNTTNIAEDILFGYYNSPDPEEFNEFQLTNRDSNLESGQLKKEDTENQSHDSDGIN